MAMPIRRMLILKTAAVALSLGTISAAEAGSTEGMARQSVRPAGSMPEGANALAPFAFIRYCVATHADCRPSASVRLTWSPHNRALVMKINRYVNKQIRQVDDNGDVWSADVAAGDCEDFALTKRRALIAAGLPASALRMAVARTARGEGHAVLVVKTDHGDFVLDNRTNLPLNWRNTDLTFVKIASAEDPRLWKALL